MNSQKKPAPTYTLATRAKWAIKDGARDAQKMVRRWQYRLNGGYKCSCCDAKIPIFYDYILCDVEGKRMMIQNYSIEGRIFCSTCLLSKIEAYMMFSADSDTDKKCDWYPERNERTISIIFGFEDEVAQNLGLDIRFGGQWWNGHHACLYAFQKALDPTNIVYRTSTITYDDKFKTVVMVDRNGIKLPTGGL